MVLSSSLGYLGFKLNGFIFSEEKNIAKSICVSPHSSYKVWIPN